MFIMTRSQRDTNPLRSSIAMITILVESINSLYFFTPCSFGSQGQLAFWSSDFTSVKNVETFADMRLAEERETEGRTRELEAWHGRRDLNPQQAVLETAALPIELLPYLR